MASHFTLAERRVLQRLMRAGHSQAQIARLIGRHPSTISRELGRNRGQRGYRAGQAQRLAELRRRACRRPMKLEDSQMREDVEQKLTQFWSPDQIAGRLRTQFSPAQAMAFPSDDLQLD